MYSFHALTILIQSFICHETLLFPHTWAGACMQGCKVLTRYMDTLKAKKAMFV